LYISPPPGAATATIIRVSIGARGDRQPAAVASKRLLSSNRHPQHCSLPSVSYFAYTFLVSIDLTVSFLSKGVRTESNNVGGVGGTVTEERRHAYQASGLPDEWPVHAVHLVVESAGIAQVVSRTVPSPQRCRDRSAVDALTTFGVALHLSPIAACAHSLSIIPSLQLNHNLQLPSYTIHYFGSPNFLLDHH
jgi:hypothetical protein